MFPAQQKIWCTVQLSDDITNSRRGWGPMVQCVGLLLYHCICKLYCVTMVLLAMSLEQLAMLMLVACCLFAAPAPLLLLALLLSSAALSAQAGKVLRPGDPGLKHPQPGPDGKYPDYPLQLKLSAKRVDDKAVGTATIINPLMHTVEVSSSSNSRSTWCISWAPYGTSRQPAVQSLAVA